MAPPSEIENARSFRKLRLARRDLALLETLSRRVKVISVHQAAKAWWSGLHAVAECRRRIKALAAAGFVESMDLWAAREIELSGPLASWRPCAYAPDFYALGRMTRRRWGTMAERMTCAVATPLCVARLGGVVRIPRLSEVTHDLHLTQVYLKKLAECPQSVRGWEGERTVPDAPPRHGQKVPDAIVRTAGRPVAIEVVGESYSPTKLFAFHEYCVANDLSYELW